ncbi:C2 domain-containing protein 5 isoform X2 [Chrysoperla carnea]|uniref:C2 domain-containing protein 5 isoform X2 n=1 Tax=Chrysoperla carnea TaxID=189513 RepID=UPI001D089CF6|nr:C2 domain-containing protein 5 isoform X2 [Chrysoperla carnea]
MPGRVKVKIAAGRNLPVMDRSSDTTDAYVEIKLSNTTYKTDVCRKSLNPQWNSEWYRFEVDDAELQDEPLQIRLMDYDMYSANDAIGKVYIDLNPLLLPIRNQVTVQASPCPTTSDLTNAFSNSGGSTVLSSGVTALGPGSVFSGWVPVYDTMHGIRGEVNITVKVELFNDFNKFKQSSCGVQFFNSSKIPFGYHARVVHGFVEELVVNDDPEYHWIDKIRTPRASNEARQTLFFKLSGEVQRKIGIKAIEVGANSVVGYHQCFDLEGDSGIVARGIGTAVTLVRIQDTAPLSNDHVFIDNNTIPTTVKHDKPLSEESSTITTTQTTNTAGAGLYKETQSQTHSGSGHCRTESVGSKGTKLNTISYIHRRSSDSDLSITPKGNSLSNAERPAVNINIGPRPTIKPTNWEMLEFPFITMSKFPPNFIRHIGGTVSARSVKLLERISNIEEPETRDAWWTELRMEIRSHARALACNVVLGYTEQASICDDVCVLSASGTAAIIYIQNTKLTDSNDVQSARITIHNQIFEALEKLQTRDSNSQLSSTTNRVESLQEDNGQAIVGIDTVGGIVEQQNDTPRSQVTTSTCQMCHVPYSESSVPYPIVMLKCAVCKYGRVPDVLISTIDMPEECMIVGNGCLIQAHVCRPKRDLRAESNAKEISDSLPFLEYDLHRLLINKLKVKGMNTIFGLRVQISIGERMLVGTASGTGVYLLPLPAPSLPKLVSGVSSTNKDDLQEKSRLLSETAKKNKEFYHLKNDLDEFLTQQSTFTHGEEDLDEPPKLDLTTGNKDSCVLEIDDAEDADILSLLMEGPPPNGFNVVNIEQVPGLDDYEVKTHLQMFTQMTRCKLPTNQYSLRFGRQFQRLLQTVYFKLRRMTPCVLCQLQFRVDIPEIDEIQLTAYGTAMGIKKMNRSFKEKKKITHSISRDVKKGLDEYDEIFTLEEDEEPSQQVVSNNVPSNLPSKQLRIHTEPFQASRHGIDITSLSYIPGGHIVQYLGNINFFFIRESTSIREGSGLSGFVHSFVTEVLAIVRAHIAALGGNAMVAYFMNECVLFRNPHKNQGQCLINVGGDVVFVSYRTETQKCAQN